jgi:peptidyl-prolyl cis-trans isomerase SurA
MLFALPGLAQGPATVPATVPGKASPPAQGGGAGNAMNIVAVVNGDVISRGDVENRRRLFALSSGLPVTNDVLDRLTPQVTQQLIDERLRLQEAQRKKIVVQDKQVAAAIADVESRNGMPAGGLSRQLAASGVAMRTLIDQIRTQIAWSQLVRQQVGLQGLPSPADIADQAAQIKAQIGQPEYRVGEIFTPVTNPVQDTESRKFVDTIIQQLRAGAPFPVVAAQFSQSQTALQGGDLGWVQGNQLDPAVLRIVKEMPIGAVSNPIKVPGGYSIVTLKAKREVGRDPATLLRVRQIWLPFSQPLNPQAPTPQQIALLEQAKRLQTTVKTCDEADAANKAAGGGRNPDPGEIRLETVSNPEIRAMLTQMSAGQITQPLPSQDGITMIFVCSKETKNLDVPGKDELTDKILSERAELTSRQIMRELQRKAVIDQRA